MATETETLQAISAPGNLKQRVMESYEIIAERYNDWTTQHNQTRLTKLAELRDVVPQLRPNGGPARVLELGCGGGRPVLETLLSDNSNLTAIANDLSPKQMSISQQNLAPYAPRVEFAIGDMASLDYPPNSFDAVIGMYTIIHLTLEEQKAMMVKIQSWLRPGGCLMANFHRDARPGTLWDMWSNEGTWLWETSAGVNETVKMIGEGGLEMAKTNVESDDFETWFWVLAKKN